MGKVFEASCSCGQVGFEGKGEPMAAIACYCDDCQAAAKVIDALPSGRSGLGDDGGTISTLFRKDVVRCVRGKERLIEVKLRPDSHATRVVASCCNSNMLTKFENWLPMVALRTFSTSTAAVVPRFCINTRYAPDATKIKHAAPRHPKIPPQLGLKVVGAALYLALPIGDGRLS